MKKLLALVLAPALLICICAHAENSPWTFNVSKKEITAYTGPGGDVTVPGVFDGVPVYRTASGLFMKRDDILSITFEEGLQVLGYSAMNGLSGLQRVALPQTLGAMDGSSLYNCGALTEVTVPAGVSFIGQNCFSWCGQLAKIVFEGECPYFHRPGTNFKQLPKDAVILVPDDQLEAYTAALPEAADRIRPSGQNAVPAPVQPDNLFTAVGGEITSYRGRDPHVAIPASIGGMEITGIGNGAFAGFNAFTVSIPEGVTRIGDEAFLSPSHLYYALLPSTLRTIGESAFHFFYGPRIVLPDGLESIGAGAFYNSSLEEITLPASLKSSGSQAFAKCYSLKKVVVLCDPGLIPEDAFEDCGPIEFEYASAPSETVPPETPLPLLSPEPLPPEPPLPAVTAQTFSPAAPAETPLPASPETPLLALTPSSAPSEAPAPTAEPVPVPAETSQPTLVPETAAPETPLPTLVPDPVPSSSPIPDETPLPAPQETPLSTNAPSGDPDHIETSSGTIGLHFETTSPVFPGSFQNGPVLETKYLCFGVSVGNTPMDPSILGGEYSLVFHADGTVTMLMAGEDYPGLTWRMDGADIVINSSDGREIRLFPSAVGFRTDYFGFMILEYVPLAAE